MACELTRLIHSRAIPRTNHRPRRAKLEPDASGRPNHGDNTFENFDWTFNPKLPQEQLRDLATGGYLVRKKQHFWSVARWESGKSHLAEGLGHHAARQGYRVEFIKTSELLSDLGSGIVCWLHC
jgi:DNA replication protein DnaC